MIYVYLHPAKVVFQAQVNEPTLTTPKELTTIHYDNVTLGSYTALRSGMMMVLGSAAGKDDLGRQRIASAQAATATQFYLPYTPVGTHDGELVVTDNKYITVYEDYRVWAKLPVMGLQDLTGGWKDGYITATGNTLGEGSASSPPPVANAGPGFAGTINSGTGRLVVDLSAANSFVWQVAGPGIATIFQWEIGDGTLTAGTLTSQNISVSFPAGFRYVRLTVTDSKGKFHSKTIPIFARDPANDLTVKHQILSHSITPQGQEISLRLLQPMPNNLLDGCQVMIWEDEPSSPSDRNHMIFIGWHHGENFSRLSQREGVLSDNVLTLLDVAGKMKLLPAFPQRMVNAGALAVISWVLTDYNYWLYTLWYLLYWHSTALEVADLIRMPGGTLDVFHFVEWSSDGGNLFGQVDDCATRVSPDHRLGCDRRGRLILSPDPNIVPYNDRALMSPTAIGYGDEQMLSIQYEGERPPRWNLLRSSAYLATSVYSVDGSGVKYVPMFFCAAPGAVTRGQGGQYTEQPTSIATSQEALNVCEGNRWARMNSPYGQVTFTLLWQTLSSLNDPGQYRWIQIRLLDRTALYGAWLRPFVAGVIYRGLVSRIDVAYEYGRTGLTRTCTITWDAETWSDVPARTTKGAYGGFPDLPS